MTTDTPAAAPTAEMMGLMDDARAVLEVIVHDAHPDEFSDARALIPRLRAALSAPVAVQPDWTPTSENINALPEPIRQYIAGLETLCDPAGIVRENAQLRDTNRGLQAMYRAAVEVAAQPADTPVPDGFALVPIKPTPAMVEVMLDWGTKRAEWQMILSAARGATPVGNTAAQPAAWLHEDGERVVSARTKRDMVKDGGASASAAKGYSIALGPMGAAQPADSARQRSIREDFDLIADAHMHVFGMAHSPAREQAWDALKTVLERNMHRG